VAVEAAADGDVNALGRRIAALIAAQGPISIAQYMTLALHDPQHGYYATRDPLGRDFTTAPEISQMFGELLGLWIAQCWVDQGKPSPIRFVELGPGKGTLMADALRATKVVRGFLQAAEIELIEASPALRAVQQEKLKDCGATITWSEHFADTPDSRPLFLIANEFFDALPIRQFVKTDRGWSERMVTVDQDGNLAFALSPVPAHITVPEARGTAPLGGFYETSAAATAIVEDIARVIAAKGGAALIVDYGYDASGGFGETFQAIRDGAFDDVLAAPGDADVTAHVDFAALADAAASGGAMAYGPELQGFFLDNLGIQGRAARLANAHKSEAAAIKAAVSRLVDLDKMGELFNALAIVAQDAPVPPVFTPPIDVPLEDIDFDNIDFKGLTLLKADNLLGDGSIEHGFFGRAGGTSKGIYASLNCGPGSNDDRAIVIKNREAARGELAPNGKLVTVHQIHSPTVVTVDEPWELGEGPQADAMVTSQREIVLGILTADCAPVLFADAEAGVIGAAHAGWKGALGGVTDNTIAAMEALGAKRSRIAAAIGPCISQANYEVGPEFRDTFVNAAPENAQFFIASDRASHFRFDLEGYVVHRLKACGISNIEPLSACTYARESEFFSFRRATHRSEPDYGREISAIVLI
jgi:NADH dehydrogenase [ubiquinone] 1 alpha subcomplex assembly factor 7